MSRRLLLTGPSFPELESHAFDILRSGVGTQPESVLYVGQQRHPEDETVDRWADYGPSAGVRVDTLHSLASEWYEHDRYKGDATHIDRQLFFRLVELAVEGISSSSNPLDTGDRFPRAGLVQEAQTLYTELAFAGLHTPEAIRDRLEREGLGARAESVAELAESIDAAREALLADELPETFLSERLLYGSTTETSPAAAFPSVDAVVLGGFTRFDPLEIAFLERFIDAWPTIALVPKGIDSDAAPGVDSGVRRVIETYRDLGFDRQHHEPPHSETLEARRRVTRSLYRHPEQSPPTDDVDAAALDLALVEPATIPEEIRATARDIRTRLGDGTQPGAVGVVLTEPVRYADQVREIFAAYDVPIDLETEVPLTATAVGDVVQTVCELAREPRSIGTVLDLLANPLVTVTHGEGSVAYHDLARVAARAETNRLESTLEHVDDAVSEPITELAAAASALANVPLDELSGRLDELLERLGVPAALGGEEDRSGSLQRRERRARDRLGRVLETLAITAPLADPGIGDTVDRLERALDGVSVQQTARPHDESVVVCSLLDAPLREFEHVSVLGLTATHFPSDPERTAFARPIYDAHADFEQKDSAAEARHHLRSLLGSTPSIRLSSPQRGVSGEPFVEADVLTELRRVVDLSAVTTAPDRSEVGRTEPGTTEPGTTEPGTTEDVQRAIGGVLPGTTEDRVTELVADAVDAGSISPSQQTRIRAGTACARARSGPGLTPYDGQLTAETVSMVHGPGEREPYSPSRLEAYAACGFKYYLRRVLGIDAPDPLTREPDARARGSYVHDVLEHYYRSLQAGDGEPVEPGGDVEPRQRLLLDVALDRLERAFDSRSSTVFQDEWLTGVLAGLGTPDENPYYGRTETVDGQPFERGLFYRFLAHEADEPARATARPTWFEARIGDPYDAGTPLSDEPAEIDTPHGTVRIHGLIDRVETVPGTDPTQVVVRDYKTGSAIPSETEALGGLKFQLQLYALMAESALDDGDVVGGAYYQVAPPRSVNSRSGLLTSQEMTTYHGRDDVGTPFLRHSYPFFETHAAFRRFVEETTAERLGELAAGIADGRFHPTVLDPSDAGCRYCDYAAVCDVRSHQRQDVIGEIDDAGMTAYVPLKARGRDPGDVLEVE